MFKHADADASSKFPARQDFSTPAGCLIARNPLRLQRYKISLSISLSPHSTLHGSVFVKLQLRPHLDENPVSYPKLEGIETQLHNFQRH